MPRVAAALLLPCALAALAGCGGNGWPDRHPARTRVLYNGKPPVGATVVLHPAAKVGDPAVVPSRGVVAADGTVSFTTYLPDDGVPEGEYVVSAFWLDPEGKTSTNRLPAKYLDPATSGHKVRIGKGDNELATIELTK